MDTAFRRPVLATGLMLLMTGLALAGPVRSDQDWTASPLAPRLVPAPVTAVASPQPVGRGPVAFPGASLLQRASTDPDDPPPLTPIRDPAPLDPPPPLLLV